MKSGLEGRNNLAGDVLRQLPFPYVSMKSGLEGRNNLHQNSHGASQDSVSMKSGLEGRNNSALPQR